MNDDNLLCFCTTHILKVKIIRCIVDREPAINKYLQNVCSAGSAVVYMYRGRVPSFHPRREEKNLNCG